MQCAASAQLCAVSNSFVHVSQSPLAKAALPCAMSARRVANPGRGGSTLDGLLVAACALPAASLPLPEQAARKSARNRTVAAGIVSSAVSARTWRIASQEMIANAEQFIERLIDYLIDRWFATRLAAD